MIALLVPNRLRRESQIECLPEQSFLHVSGGKPGRVDRLHDSAPMKRGGSFDEVAGAVMWLESAEASYVTGTDVDVTVGRKYVLCDVRLIF